MRIVLDSNVIIAAFASRGICQAIFEYCLESHEVILCESIIKEIKKNLRTKIRVPAPVIGEIETYLRESTNVERPAKVDPEVFEDKSDLPVLGVAQATGSSYIITGDRSLQGLKKYGDTAIISPRSFWETLKKKTNN